SQTIAETPLGRLLDRLPARYIALINLD
ncbi:MAG: hypothetical protein RJB11_1464, partial [Planctomycetota bacterium]